MVFGFGSKKKKPQKPKGEVKVNADIKKEAAKEEINIKEKIEKGYIHARVIIEILGAPKDHIESTLEGYVEKIKTEKDMHFLSAEFSDTKEEGKLFSRFAEVEILFKNPSVLIGFCFDYMPSSVEVIEPERPELTSDDLSMLFNDMQAKLHGMDMVVKQLRTENTNLRTNAAALLRNMVITILKQGSLRLDELSKKVGVPSEQLKPFLDNMKEQGFVKEEEGSYYVGDYMKKEKPQKTKKSPKKK